MDCLDYRILGNAKNLFKEQNGSLQKRISNILSTLFEGTLVSRREGLLSLEEMIYRDEVMNPLCEHDKKFLSTAILLIVDGTDPDLVTHILRTYIAASGENTVEEFIKYIITAGVLSIQQAENPRVLEEKLRACVPDICFADAADTYEKRREEAYARESKKNKEIFLKDYPKPLSSKHLTSLEKTILRLTDNQLQRCLREIDNNELASILKYCSIPVREKIFANLSKRLVEMMIDDVLMYSGTEEEMGWNAQKILNIVQKLKDYGEI